MEGPISINPKAHIDHKELKPLSELTDYIIKFLLHGNEHLADRVGYTADVSEYHKYSVIITP